MEDLLKQMLEQIKYSPNFENDEKIESAIQLKRIFKKLYGVGTPQWAEMKKNIMLMRTMMKSEV